MSDVRLTATNPEDSSVVPVACNSKGELLTVPPVIEQIDNDVRIIGGFTVNDENKFAVNRQLNTGFDLFIRGEPLGTNNSFSCVNLVFSLDGNYDQFIWGFNHSWSSQGFSSTQVLSAFNTSLSASNKVATPKAISGYRASISADANQGGGPTYAFYASSSAPSWFGGEVIVSSRNKRWTLVEQGGLCHMVQETTSYSPEEDEALPVEKDYPKLRDVFNELNMIEGALEQVMTKLRMVPPANWEVWDGSNETA